MPHATSRHHQLWLLAPLLVGLTSYWTLLRGEFPFAGDVLLWHLPLRLQVVAAWRAGEWPLWTPASMLGAPLLANMDAGALYPFTLLFLLLPPAAAVSAYVVVHHAAAGMATYALLRTWQMQRPSAVLGATVFMWSPYLVQMDRFLPWLGLAWIPLLLRAVHHLVERPGPRSLAAVAACFALLVTNGEPQIVYWGVLLGGSYVCIIASADRSTLQRAVASFGVAGLLGAGLVMAQLLPTAELGLHSDRSGGVPVEVAQLWSFHPVRVVEWLVPGFFGGQPLVSPGTAWGFFLHNYPGHNAWSVCVGVGAAPLALAVAATVVRPGPRGVAAWLVAVFGISLLLGFGQHLPVHGLVRSVVPGFAIFRYPEKHLALCTLALALLAGLGLDTLIAGSARARRAAMLASVVGCVLLVVLLGALVAQREELASWMRAQVLPHVVRPIEPADLVGATLAACLTALLAWLACVLILASRVSDAQRAALLAGVGALELISVDTTLVRTASSRMLEPPPLASVLRTSPEQPFRVHRANLEWTVQRNPHDDGVDIAMRWWEARTMWANTGVIHGVHPAFSMSNSRLRGLHELNEQGALAKLLPVLNIRFHIEALSLESPQAPRRRVAIDEAAGVQVVEDTSVVPRAFFIPRATYLATDEAVTRAMVQPTFSPRSEAYLVGDGLPVSAGDARVVGMRHERNRVVVETEATNAAVLILSDPVYPGWRVRIDGEDAPLARADHILRAAVVPAGKHRVVFEYRPRTFAVGFACSVLAWTVWLLLWWRGRRERPVAASATPRASA